MPYPRSFRDDGQVLLLDVHGCSVADALVLTKRVLAEGFRHGRARLDVVHGFSSTDSPHANTIKNGIARAWEEGEFADWVADLKWDDVGGASRLWLKVGGGREPGRITTMDIT